MGDYQRVAKAIKYISEHAKEQPSLEEVAEAVHLSPYHFHRVFKEWAGVTPKEFLQFTSLDRAKKVLEKNHTIEEATFQTGLSSTSRLHDLFVNIEGMTPGEFKNRGRKLGIKYQFSKSPFGNILIASTGKGICSLQFVDTPGDSLEQLNRTWHNAEILEAKDNHIENLENLFSRDWENLDQIKLHIRGTDFQLKVWEALLKVPPARLTTYSDLADQIGNPKAYRAVGSAIGRNPVAYLIPCHRVIKKVGEIGEYRWGSTRKKAIIGWEAARRSVKSD